LNAKLFQRTICGFAAFQGCVFLRAPTDDSHLRAQLLSIALSARELAAQAIDKKPVSVPSTHRDVLEKFFPLLADIVVEVCRAICPRTPAATETQGCSRN